MPKRTLTVTELKDLDNRFTYHAPHGDQTDRYKQIRDKGKELAVLMSECCPASRELATALTQLTLVTMLANSAIAIGEQAPISPP